MIGYMILTRDLGSPYLHADWDGEIFDNRKDAEEELQNAQESGYSHECILVELHEVGA